MYTVIYLWIELPDNQYLVDLVKRFGVRRLARLVGLSPGMITHWTKGRCGMSLHKAERIMEEVGYDPDRNKWWPDRR